MPEKTANRIALVFGASGLVGSELVQLLTSDESYSSVIVFVRHPMDSDHKKIQQHVIDFGRLVDFSHLIRGDDLFICLGTTIRKAGSVGKVEEIDRDLPVTIAQIAYANGVRKIAVVSSIGADSSSRNYYLRIKGEMEAGISRIPFDQTVIARPSMLLGRRNEFRFGEHAGKIIMKGIGFLMVGSLRKYRGIDASTVARAMIALIGSSRKDVVFASDELQNFHKK